MEPVLVCGCLGEESKAVTDTALQSAVAALDSDQPGLLRPAARRKKVVLTVPLWSAASVAALDA